MRYRIDAVIPSSLHEVILMSGSRAATSRAAGISLS